MVLLELVDNIVVLSTMTVVVPPMVVVVLPIGNGNIIQNSKITRVVLLEFRIVPYVKSYNDSTAQC